MSYADSISLEMDGMKSPKGKSAEGSPDEEASESSDEKDMEASNGQMALEAIKKNDGAAFEEAIKSIMSGM